MTFLKWLLALIIDRAFAALGNLIAAGRRDAANKEAGRQEQRADALAKEAEDLRASQEAINEARGRHKADPTDDAFKNSPFRD